MPYRFTDASRYPYRAGALYLGEDQAGNEVGILTERHAFTVGGSRAGKGTCNLIPNARRWAGTLLCIDPKGENLEQTYEHREALGQRVYGLMPFGGADVPDRVRASFNPLRDIDLSSPTARSRIKAIADGLVVVHDPRHMEWVDGARDDLAGIIAYMIEQAPQELRTFATMRAILMQPDEVKDTEGNPALDANGNLMGLYADAQRMASSMAGSGLARAAGVSMMTALTSEKGMDKDFLNLARRATSWLDDEAITTTLGGESSFSLSELRDGTASLFLVIPPQFIETHAAFLRLVVSCALNAMAEGGQKHQAECLFLLDEFYALGRIDKIRTSAGLMPSYGVHLWPFVQNFGDAVELYGAHGMTAFLNNADAVIFFGNNGDQEALEYQSRRIGPLSPSEVVEGPPLPAAFQGPSPPRPEPFVPLPQPRPIPFSPLPQPAAAAFQGRPPPTKDQWYERTHLAHGFFFPAESENQSRERLATHQENQMREWQHHNAGGEAAHRAEEETRMREWQRNNAAAEAEHRAKEEACMRDWQRQNAEAEAAHRAHEESRMRDWQQDVADLRAMHEAEQVGMQRVYDYAMREAFTPRLPPSEILKLTGKGHGEKLARSMIVFAPAGDVLNVQLVPYFRPPPVLLLEDAKPAVLGSTPSITLSPSLIERGFDPDHVIAFVPQDDTGGAGFIYDAQDGWGLCYVHHNGVRSRLLRGLEDATATIAEWQTEIEDLKRIDAKSWRSDHRSRISLLEYDIRKLRDALTRWDEHSAYLERDYPHIIIRATQLARTRSSTLMALR